MADLVTRLALNNSGFNSGIESSKQKVKELQETADDTSKSIQDLGTRGSKSARELLEEMSNTEQAVRGASNYKRQLMEIQKTIADLTIGYRSMSDEMKNSALGQEVAAKIQELTQKASEYKDAIEDANASVKALASDTAGWDAMRQGIDAVSAGLQGFAALGIVSANSTEKLVKVIAKLKAIEAATNAVIKIGNALQRNSALMMGVSKVQALALAAAKRTETTATVGATIAQKAFNVVAKANPYVLLATAVIAVGTALVTFTRKTKEAEAAEKAHQEQLEKEEEKFNDYKDTVSSTVGSVVGKFMSLTVSYRNLTSEMQKKRWIQENKSAFEDLGLKVSDVNSADEIFIRQTELVIAALKSRAKATALQSMYEKEYQKEIAARIQADKLWENRQRANTNKIMTTGGGLNSNGLPDEWNKAGANTINVDYTYEWGGGQSGAGWIKLTPEGERKLNEYFDGLARAAGDNIVSAATSDIAALERMWEEAEREAISAEHAVASLVTPGGRRSGGSGGGNNEDPAIAGSLRAAQEEVQRLQALLNNMNPEDVNFEKTKEDLAAARKELERIQALVNIPALFEPGSLDEANHFVQFFSKELSHLDPNTDEFQETLDLLNAWKTKQKEINDLINKTNVEYVEGSLAEANAKVAELQEQLKNLNPDTEEFQNVLTLLNQWKQKQDDINAAINGTTEKVKTVADKYKDIVSQASDISLAVNIGEIDPAEGRRQIAELNKKLSEMGLTVKVDLEFDTKIEKFQEAMSSITDQISEPISAINSVKSAYKTMMDSFEDPEKDGWDQFFATFQFGTSIIEALNTVLTVLNTIQELVAASRAKSAVAATTEAAATTADASAQGADAAATITNAAAHGALASAEGAASVASIPYVGPILAIAAIASIMAAIIGMISSAKSYATGGVIDAPSKIGDKNIIRVNGGEMILNSRQQANLFKLLDEGRKDTSSNIGGNVEFKIRGTDLVGTLSNYQKKTSKV